MQSTVAGLFHPATAIWFEGRFGSPTDAQAQAWPAIRAGHHTLIAAPTGSGKTLAAFLAVIDDLIRQGLETGLPDATQIIYVSPLKALSNDIEKNLKAPLEGIRAALRARDLPDVNIRVWLRTGDTPAKERQQMGKRPPHIVVTTPESLYILLGSVSGRRMLATTRTVIVDEIHALAPNKRGTHLALSLERLSALCDAEILRIGLGATQKPIAEMARFLVGAAAVTGNVANCTIVDAGHVRIRDISLVVPPSPLEAVMSGEQWKQVYDRLTDQIQSHRTTLVFVNTRRMVERVSRQLSERIGEDQLAAHHGSLSREQRLDAEQRLKHGKLKALVATASLELGIDIGEVDLVCQLGSPRSIASFLQRVGRSGHAVLGTPKGRLFPLTRDELVECTALLEGVGRGELDVLTVPSSPSDVLAQQIVAETAAQDWRADDLYVLVRRAWPYRALPRADFDAVVAMLATGFTTRRGRRGALLHHDAVNGMLRGRRGARLTALTSGGAIPDNADYRVQLEPDNLFIGTVHEDFAVESLAGDVFQLGNQSYRIIRVERGVVRVENARGQPPTIPFWLGEAPGRSDELSLGVSRLRADVSDQIAKESLESLPAWLTTKAGVGEDAARDLACYLGAGHAALGCLPTQNCIVFERFFDESGGMQLVVHSPYGSRINRAWGLALRKRFCGKFNFELQAAATEDNIVLSLSAGHSFSLEDVKSYLHSNNVRRVLTEALLDAPMFATRWRWVASVSLALPRFRGGKKRPPQITRMDAEDLLAAVFPDQVACAENLAGPPEIPDHPLVNQTIDDCLHEAMDIDGLENLLRGLESGAIAVVARDLTEPSPLAQEVLTARPYAYLDDAPLEERRTQAVQSRRWMPPDVAADLGRLDADAIARVRNEAWPEPRNPDELHDALVWLGFVTGDEARAQSEWAGWLRELADQGRVTCLTGHGPELWLAAERLPQFQALWPQANIMPVVFAPKPYSEKNWSTEAALVEIVRGRLEGEGPLQQFSLAAALGLPDPRVDEALRALEVEGFALRGQFSSLTAEEWCERRLLARIHRYTVHRLRAEIEPVAARDFMRFLLRWQHVTADTRMEGPDALGKVLAQCEGFEAPASAWESDILPARLVGYASSWLDQQCLAGRVTWASLGRRNDAVAPIRTTPITFLTRRDAKFWLSLASGEDRTNASTKAQAVMEYIRSYGASFFDELIDGVGLMRSEMESALAELVTLGRLTSDSFEGLRALLRPAHKRDGGAALRRRAVPSAMENAGRWGLVVRPETRPDSKHARAAGIEHVARTLLSRYGVIFQRLLEREARWLPPWRELLTIYRRLEDRGEIRGGRFVAGYAGEQFALPDALGMLRQTRRDGDDGELVSLSGADPLNLVGILTPGPKLPALRGNRVLYQGGVPVALLAGEVKFLEEVDTAVQWQRRNALIRAPSTIKRPHGELQKRLLAASASKGR